MPLSTSIHLLRGGVNALLFAVVGLLATFPQPALADDVLTLLNGEEVTGNVTRVFRDGAMAGQDLPAGLSLEQLLVLQRDVSIQQDRFLGAKAYLASRAGALGAESLTLTDDFCTLNETILGEVRIKVDRLGSLLFTEGPPAEVFLLAQETPLRLSDIVFLNTDDGPRAIECLLESVTAETITISWEGELRDVSAERVYGIVFAERTRDRNSNRCYIRFTNGDELAGTILELQDGKLTLQTVFSPGLELPYDEITRIEIDSPRHAYLSDLEPINVEESTILSLPSPWQRNLSVGGRPLQLGDRQYSHGLGVHAESRLTFRVEREFDTFQAVVGIDAETEGHGDCIVVILADGRELFRQRVQGGEPPLTIRLELESPRRITLAVEPGEGYDLADHVSWCDVRLLNLSDD